MAVTNVIPNASFPIAFLLLLLVTVPTTLVRSQFNEPPGQRREQTYRVLEFEVSNVNQHYPGDLRYYCTFRGKWSEERHPRDFPTAAYRSFSAPVMISHSKGFRMWTGTETVTAGVEYLAEEGFPTIMYNEFDNGGFETLMMTVGERMFNTTGSQHLPPINVTYSHPWLSAMSKITPSPDWFVGFSDLRTISYDTETYYNRIVIQSYVWDAGTDDGQTYLAFDRDLDPQVPCMRFCVPAHWGGGGEGTQDSNIVHHPMGNSKQCPDLAKGRTPIPYGGQFLDYTHSYIPYPAEFECVLRVGDGEIYAGNEFNESQIRPPLYVPRPDDDFLMGISPYDSPAYEDLVASLEEGDMPEEEEDTWNKNILWLLILPFGFFLFMCLLIIWYFLCYRRRREEGEKSILADDEDGEDAFLDEGSFYGDEEMEQPGSNYSLDPTLESQIDEDGNIIDDDDDDSNDAAESVDEDYEAYLMSQSEQEQEQYPYFDYDEDSRR